MQKMRCSQKSPQLWQVLLCGDYDCQTFSRLTALLVCSKLPDGTSLHFVSAKKYAKDNMNILLFSVVVPALRVMVARPLGA